MRSVKKQNEQKTSGASAEGSKLYMYHKQMSFLKKVTHTSSAHESVNGNEEETNINEGNSEDIEISAGTSVSSCRPAEKKRKTDQRCELDNKMMKFMDYQINVGQQNQEDNHHLCFFKGLLPSLSSLNDEQTLEFQGGVINLLQQIKRKAQTPLTHVQPQNVCHSYHQWQHPGYLSQPHINTSVQATSPTNENAYSPTETMSTATQHSDYSTDIDFM